MEQLAKNQIHTARITGYSSAGAGVARIGGRAVFVENALAGEEWEILILKVSSAAVYGKGLCLISPSPERMEPECPHFGPCGGCDLMHMSYGEELRFKLERVNDALRRIGGLDFRVPEIIGADSLPRYRNKAIYNISGTPGRAVAGFYRERSHDVVPLEDCLIQTEPSARCASALIRHMNENGIPPYDEATGRGLIRRLFTRCSVKYPQSVAVIVSAKGLGAKTEGLVPALREECPELTGIVLCVNGDPGNAVLSGSLRTLWGSEYIEDELLGVKFRVSPLSFFQVNPPQAEKLYSLALEYASPQGGGTVLDLYCGAGTISLCLAGRAEMVYGAEIVPQAIDNARKNARLNCIKNAEFLLADAAEAAARLKKEGVRPDAIVVDPPRKGLSPDLIQTITEMAPPRIVYVSCDPATLSRDLKLFAERGYKAKAGAAVDMFPRTRHVETVCLLSKLQSKEHIEIEVKMDELDLTSAESKATYEEIKAYVLEYTGLKVSYLYIAQVKQKYGIIERENYNKPKSENAKQPQCPPEKEKAIMEALKHFGMIL